MLRIPVCLAAAIAVVATLAVPARAEILVGQVDDFEDGGLQDWEAGGAQNPYGPTIAMGGPGGVGDHYLHLASGGSGPGGKLVAFNWDHQWAGDYLAAGVTAIRMQVNNLGTTDLMLRLILALPEVEFVPPSLTTLSTANVPAGSGWTTVSFSLAPGNLTGDAYDVVMGNVDRLSLVHSPDVIFHRRSAPNLAAQLGVDNITAVPEPSTLVLAALGFAAVMYRTARTLGRPAQIDGRNAVRAPSSFA